MKRFYLLLCLGWMGSYLAAQPVMDGVINDTDWGSPLSEADLTYATTPGPGFGPGHEINSIHAYNDASNLYLAISGNVQAGNRILVFIDSKAGGYSDGNFGRTGAPAGIGVFNSGTTFDPGFQVDYCLVIGTDGASTYFFDLFELTGTAGSGGGPNNYLGDNTAPGIGAAPANSDKSQGFEITISLTDLGYVGGVMQFMGMYTSDGGFLSNQFLTPAGAGDGNYTDGAVTFGAAAPNPVSFSPTFPVNLMAFRGALTNGAAHLSWTATEEAFSHYDVQRLNADGAFEEIGQVEARGENGVATSYQFLDPATSAMDKLVYRLAMVDIDGSVNYSHKIELTSAGQRVSLSPNPTAGQLTVELPAPIQSTGAVEVYDLRGQQIWSSALEATGQSRWTFDLGQLPAGVYQAAIRWDGQRSVQRITLY